MNIAGAQLEDVSAAQAAEIIKETINTMLQEGNIMKVIFNTGCKIRW